MKRHIALLRGINVGKAKRVAMADLRALMQELGFTNVLTLLNSGNAAFDAGAGSADAHAKRLRAAIVERVGGHAAWLWCADGVNESRVAKAVGKVLKERGTARNRATLAKLQAMVEAA